MGRLNHHYTKLASGYLFGEINRKAAAFREKGLSIINLGIGDVTHPLSPSISKALIDASMEMGQKESFKGYGPTQGYLFLRDAIAKNDYARLKISPDEIFISDGAKNDLANLQELFAQESKIAVPNPAYPVYIDTNVMAGRTRPLLKRGGFGGVVYLPLLESQKFSPEIPNRPVDLIYLCSPNNPTGTSMTHEELSQWVSYAKKNRAVILFDGAYEAYIRSSSPRSIYEIEGAKEVAIEVRSFSKTAGFSGLRCSYTVIPHQLKVIDGTKEHSLHALWTRRQETKFNGTSYPIQKAAEAVYSDTGKQEVKRTIDQYLENAKYLKQNLEMLGYIVYGGEDAPYLWLKVPNGFHSWSFFDRLLEKYHILCVPGLGFGSEGDGFIRLSAFAPIDQINEAISRMRDL